LGTMSSPPFHSSRTLSLRGGGILRTIMETVML
jgi:hypothetical protein